MYNERIILNNYSKGSYGNILQDNNKNIYKITKISENGLTIASNINEIIILNYLLKIKKIICNEIYDNADVEQVNFNNLIKFNNDDYSQIVKENIFMQTKSFDYYNYENFYNKFILTDYRLNVKYKTYMTDRIDKFLLVNKMKFYDNNLTNFIEKFHFYVINNFNQITKKILINLSIIHHNGILHGDLKSQNILINDINSVVITDFGAVKMTNFNKYYLSCTISSRCPEDLAFEYSVPKSSEYNSSFKSDIWSLGLIFAEMILGYNPILKLYKKIYNLEKSMETIEKEILLYYQSIEYIDIKSLVKNNPTKYQLSKELYKQIDIIEKMLFINPEKRLENIEQVYELLYEEKFLYNYRFSYDYDYTKFYSENKFNLLHSLRKEHYPRLFEITENLNLLFICPLAIDILDRFFLKILDYTIESNSELKTVEINFLFCSIIILVSGLYNQSNPQYNKIFALLNIVNNAENLGNVNNNLLEVLILMEYDIIRPYNIYYCHYLAENKTCSCINKTNENQNLYYIHNLQDKDKLLKILKNILENNVIGIEPQYYFDKLR